MVLFISLSSFGQMSEDYRSFKLREYTFISYPSASTSIPQKGGYVMTIYGYDRNEKDAVMQFVRLNKEEIEEKYDVVLDISSIRLGKVGIYDRTKYTEYQKKVELAREKECTEKQKRSNEIYLELKEKYCSKSQ